MTETMPTSEVLNRAADLIEERGWVQGPIGMSSVAGSPLCLEGAISAAAGLGVVRCGDAPILTYPGSDCSAYASVRAHLGPRLRAHLGPRLLYVWNDEPGRTATEVIEVLRACAVIEASRERQAVSA